MIIQVIRQQQPETGRQPRPDRCVGQYCELGCQRVPVVIRQRRAGQNLPEPQGLEVEDREQVLRELTAIMSVYKGGCNSP